MKYDQIADLILEKVGGYKPVKLPYALNALEPVIDEKIMNFHYNKHYKGYIKKLNDALSNTDKDLVDVVKSAANKKDAIRNNAGGAYNHQIFWFMMKPGGSKFEGEIKEKIEKQFGSFDSFKKDFIEQAKGVFGSGWLWLVQKGNKLKFIPTHNQDNPLMFDKNVKILLGVDVWEHSYYIQYGPDREKYLKNFLKIVDWSYCNQQLTQ